MDNIKHYAKANFATIGTALRENVHYSVQFDAETGKVYSMVQYRDKAAATTYTFK